VNTVFVMGQETGAEEVVIGIGVGVFLMADKHSKHLIVSWKLFVLAPSVSLFLKQGVSYSLLFAEIKKYPNFYLSAIEMQVGDAIL
jgi:hypothetical protein